MSSAEFDSHLAGHRNGKAFLNGLLIAFGPFMMGMPEKTFLNLKWTPDSPIASMAMLMKTVKTHVQGSSNRRAPGFVNFVPAVAYHFCLNLPAAFTQPGARLLVEPCMSHLPNSPMRDACPRAH